MSKGYLAAQGYRKWPAQPMLPLAMLRRRPRILSLAFASVALVPAAAYGAAKRGKEGAKDGAEDVAVNTKERKFMIGLEAVGMQVPALRPGVTEVDPRFVGDSATLGGAGLFGRFRPRPIIGVDLGVRSGSVRYRSDDEVDVISQDLILAEAGVLLYLARGDVGQFALDAGMGGIYNRVKYELGDREGTQEYGSGFVRIGADAEFLVKRVAFVLTLRSYGVFTVRDNVANKGAIMAAASDEARRAPVAKLQTFIVATAGIAYRF